MLCGTSKTRQISVPNNSNTYRISSAKVLQSKIINVTYLTKEWTCVIISSVLYFYEVGSRKRYFIMNAKSCVSPTSTNHAFRCGNHEAAS
jgi:hypothetical protein